MNPFVLQFQEGKLNITNSGPWSRLALHSPTKKCHGPYLSFKFTSCCVSQPLSPDSETSWEAAWGFSGGSEPLPIRVEVVSYKSAISWSEKEVRLQRSGSLGFKTSLTVVGRIKHRVVSTVYTHTHRGAYGCLQGIGPRTPKMPDLQMIKSHL